MAKGRQRTIRLANSHSESGDREFGFGKTDSSDRTDRAGRADRDVAGVLDSDEFRIEEVGERWLRVQWQLTSKTLDRANSVMGREGHGQQRVLRVHGIDQGEAAPPSKTLLSQIEIPTGAGEWFLRVPSTCPVCLVELGVLFGKGRFFSLLHSSPTEFTSRFAHQRRATYLGESTIGEEAESGEPPSLRVQGTFVLNGQASTAAKVLIDDMPVSVDSKTGNFEWQMQLANGRVVVPVRVLEAGRICRALLAIETNFHLLSPEPDDEG